MKISISMRGQEKVIAFLSILPRGVKIAAMSAYSEYMIGDERHGLKHEPEQKFVSRADAYGDVSTDGAPKGYFSWKQFRKVAAITKGFTETPWTRNNPGMASQWFLSVKDSNWTSAKIQNPNDAAGWVFGDQQARQPAKVGWRKYSDVMESNAAGAMRKAIEAVQIWLTKQSKK